jgi:mono/diheme cytochrome c family protein
MSWKLLLAMPLAAVMGGWATISVEDLPDYLVAGQPTTITFAVRQHGVEPMNRLTPTLEARAGSLGATAAARALGNGRYEASLSLAEPGDWTVTINSGYHNARVRLLPIPVVQSAGRTPVTLTAAERGERLFVAKGCQTCHVDIDVGPKLKGRTFEADYLARWLANPQAVRANAEMPNLNLKPAEITALVAYINRAAS